MTILSRVELEQLALSRTGRKKVTKELVSELLWSFVDAVESDWKALGRGQVEHDQCTATYVVLDWPTANAWRHTLGLAPADFHITLGFSSHDVHGVKKDRSTLI